MEETRKLILKDAEVKLNSLCKEESKTSVKGNCSYGSWDDRFIPNRSAINFELGHYLVSIWDPVGL